MDRQTLDQMIADMERQQREAAAVLPHLRAARAALDDPGRAQSKAASKAQENGHSNKQNLFEPKFKKPGKDLIVDVLAGLGREEIAVGLSLRQLQEALTENKTPFSDQFVMYALKELQKEGLVQKIPAPQGARAKWNHRMNPNHLPMEDA